MWQIDTWFGASTTNAQLKSVTDRFDIMSARFINSVYNCAPSSTPEKEEICNGNVFAYVNKVDLTQTIYMCQFTFEYHVSLLSAVRCVNWCAVGLRGEGPNSDP